MKSAETTNRDGHTRDAIVALLMARGSSTAADIGASLGISATAVRRHLDNLADAAEITTASRARHSGRGRPAKEFLLTPAGRRRHFRQGYDALAIDALRALRTVGGDQAVRAFARNRVTTVLSGAGLGDFDAPLPSEVEDHASSDVAHNGGAVSAPRSAVTVEAVSHTASRMAEKLTEAGFSADIQIIGNGVQICQHHCPVAEAAAEFPELCEAEIAVFSQALGTHVQRLATIANGDRACTTHVPIPETAFSEPVNKEQG